MTRRSGADHTTLMSFDHEQVRIQRGPRSGLSVIVAMHSTALGQAIGGCRLARYPHWHDALTDALRLSSAMTDKCAVAGLPNGGGKTVVAIPPDMTLTPADRRAILHDVADVIAALDGAYATGPDVGTDPTGNKPPRSTSRANGSPSTPTAPSARPNGPRPATAWPPRPWPTATADYRCRKAVRTPTPA
jgi:hypothetical protein